MGIIAGAIILLLLLVYLATGLNEGPVRRGYYDDSVCRCGSHTPPGFICSRCGKEA